VIITKSSECLVIEDLIFIKKEQLDLQLTKQRKNQFPVRDFFEKKFFFSYKLLPPAKNNMLTPTFI